MSLSAVQQFLFRNVYIILISITGFVFTLLLAHYSGIGISPDSVTYASVAKNFAEQGRFIQFDEAPYIDFPVGYPIFLGIIYKLTASNFIHSGIYINAILFAAIIFICGLALQKSNINVWLKIAVLMCIVFSPGLLEVYSMLWSETLFIFLSVLFIVALITYSNKISIRNLLTASVIVAIMCTVRYAGIAFIAAGLFIIFFVKHNSIKQKLIHLILFGCIAILLLCCNLLRNYYVSDYTTGEREKSLTSLHDNIYYAGLVFCNWLSVSFKNHWPATILATIIIILLATAITWHLIKQKEKNAIGYISAVTALAYISFIITIASVSRFETIDSRLLSPAFIPLVIAFFYWLNKIVITNKGNIKPVYLYAAILISSTLIYGEFSNSFASYNDIKDYGIPGYTDDDWRLSPTVKFIQSHKNIFRQDVEIYSDANDAVFFFTGHTAQQLPHKQFPEDIKDFFDEDECYVIWFNLGADPDFITAHDILKNRTVKLVARFNDGAVYFTEKKK